MDIKLAELQGDIWPGFQKDHEALVLVGFPDAEAGQRWLRSLLAEIASADEVLAFKRLFQLIRSRKPRQELEVITSRWLNVAFSWRGLARLAGRAEVERFSATFKNNAPPGARQPAELADVHALLVLAADRGQDLDVDVERERARLRQCGGRELRIYRGATLPGDQRGQEHFGFRDGISQPVLAGFPEGAQCGPVIPAGEFILGEPDARGEASIPGPAWARGGSFLSFVQLEQHVEAFRAAMRQQAGLLGLDPEELAARVVGRWRDGAPVSEPPPRLAHVGRARPRWLPEQDVARHRILRRGIPYGAPPGDGHPDAGERGLLFLAYQADLARQFEHVWLQWLNDPNFPGPNAGRDGLVGQAAAPGSVALGSVAAGPVVPTRLASVASIGRAGGPATLRLPEFVSPGYGGYFFAPSKGALAQLAG